MRKAKFLAVWLLIFGVLAVFSAASIESLSGIGAKKAYAATIKSDSQLQSASHLAVVNGTAPGFNGRELLCAVNNDQTKFLEAALGATIDQVPVDGQPVNFVAVPKQHRLNQNEIRQMFGDVHCHVILQNNLFYVLFKGDVS